MPTFIIKTSGKDKIVEADNRFKAVDNIEDFTDVIEFDPETQKLCPNRDECGCDVMPTSHNFCHLCGAEL